jgi:ribonuclease P protein component
LGRQSVDPVFASLARRRPDLSSAHFGLSYLVAEDVEPRSAQPQSRGRLGFSVPKRLLARAVDRNALKRVAREAWRHASWSGIVCPGAAMIKLRRVEPEWRKTPRSALKKAWRSELDELIRRLAARVRANQRGAASSPSGGAAVPLPADPSPTRP